MGNDVRCDTCSAWDRRCGELHGRGGCSDVPVAGARQGNRVVQVKRERGRAVAGLGFRAGQVDGLDNVKPENYQALLDTWNEFGHYPLSLL